MGQQQIIILVLVVIIVGLGTILALQLLKTEYVEFMEEERFLTGKSSPCVFRHPERKLRVVIHGDDFTVLGFEKDLD